MDIGNTQNVQNLYGNAEMNRLKAMQRSYENLEAQAKKTLSPKDMEKIEKAAKEYEAVFISEMLNQTFKDVSFDPMNGDKNSAQDVYKSMMLQEYGSILADRGGVGLADDIKSQLLELQMAAQK